MQIGASLPTLLTIVFVILKLTHVIDWSWWWVMSPMVVQVGLFVIVIASALAVKGSIDKRGGRR